MWPKIGRGRQLDPMWPRTGRGQKLNLSETRIDPEGKFHSLTVRNDLHPVNLTATACAVQTRSPILYRIPERKRNQNVERTCEFQRRTKLLKLHAVRQLTLWVPRENNRRAGRHGLVNPRY